MVSSSRLALSVMAVAAILPAQSCPRPAPPPGGFPTHVDSVIAVTYSDGYQTFASLVRPDVTAPSCGWPLVVFVHPLGGSRADDFAFQLDVAAHGYAVWSYDVRGQGQAVAQNPGHLGAGTTLWGPVERADLAEQIGFVAGEPGYAGIVDPTRAAVVGSSQGGAHAWAAAAWSGLPFAVTGRPPLVFPTIACAVAHDYVAESADDWLRGGALWSSWFVEALAGSYAGLPLDPALVQNARSAFVAQDPAILLGTFLAERRGIAADLAVSQVPLFYSHSYHDRIDSPLLGLRSLQTMTSPHRALLTTGGHNSPQNDHERAYRNALTQRWLDRWLWDEPNEVDLEVPYVISELPLAAALRDDPTHSWSRQHVVDPLVPASATRLWLHDDLGLHETAPLVPQQDESIAQVIDPQATTFTPQDYLDQGAVRALGNVLAVCPLDEVVYSLVTAAESELGASAALHLRVVPRAADWMVAVLLTVESPGSNGEEVMLCSGAVHSQSSTPDVAEEHDLLLPPVAVRVPAGATVRLRLRNLWLREQPMAPQLEVAPRFHDFRVDVVHSDPVTGEGSWLDLPLAAVRPKISASSNSFDLLTAPPLSLYVRGGVDRAGLPYYVTFGMSGQVPATPFLNDVLPLEYDWLVGVSTVGWMQPEFTNFLYDLDAAGEATAVLDFSAWAPLPLEFVGLRLTFAAFVFDAFGSPSGAATNPCDVVLK
ncbi:MAG: acetylxylan esterase [Planctomycetes bacterium]|nr:acetylxylan esterase [Planctomycetota bacterium]